MTTCVKVKVKGGKKQRKKGHYDRARSPLDHKTHGMGDDKDMMYQERFGHHLYLIHKKRTKKSRLCWGYANAYSPEVRCPIVPYATQMSSPRKSRYGIFSGNHGVRAKMYNRSAPARHASIQI